MRRVQMETWHLVKLHSLRCLKNGIELPDYSDVTFYAHCFTGLVTTSYTHFIEHKNPDLWQSIKVYMSQQQQSGFDKVRHQPGYTELKAELASQMVVNAIVMVSQHFIKRLRLYVQITFGGLGSNDGGEQSKEGKALVKDIMRACFNTDETDIVEALQMRDVLTPAGTPWGEQWIPWANHVKENGLGFYVRLIWEFQSVVEGKMAVTPNAKDVRAFSLFPEPTSYSAAHTKINGSTLAGFYSRIMLRVEGYHWYAPGTVLTVHSFQANRWAMLRAAFDIARFETRTSQSPLTKVAFDELSVEDKYDHASRLFANQVTSDGYGASILIYKPKQEDKAPSDAPVIPVGYVPDIVIGLDPGMRSVCTAMWEVFRPNAGRHRRRRRRRRRGGGQRMPGRRDKRPRWIRRFKDPVRQNDREIVQVSAREYHHLEGFKRFQSWNEGLKK